METLARASFFFHLPSPSKLLPKSQIYQQPFSSNLSKYPTNKSSFKLYTTTSSTVSNEFLGHLFEEETEVGEKDEKFHWFSQWYPIMLFDDLDKRAPHGKKVMGLDIVVWWDKIENAWKVFDDMCSHRLAPFSEGMIDQWGRLQCVCHGWCFGGAADCKFIPQAPRDGPPLERSCQAFVHDCRLTNQIKRVVAIYPSTVENGIVWFWPSTDPNKKDILIEKKPPYIPEFDDPSYTRSMGSRIYLMDAGTIVDCSFDISMLDSNSLSFLFKYAPKIAKELQIGSEFSFETSDLSRRERWMAIYPLSSLFSRSLKFHAKTDEIVNRYRHFPYRSSYKPTVISDRGTWGVYLEFSLE